MENNRIIKNKVKFIYLFIPLFLLILGTSCNRAKITRTDTVTSGEAMIVADECFAPIVTEEINVFTGLNLDAHIIPLYTSETNAFDLMMKDSIRLVIAARDLTETEKEHLKKIKRTPRSQRIAIDGIALIINNKNTDSLISIAMLQKIMTGEINHSLKIVFDNQNSSTVRFIKDSVCKGKQLASNLVAAESNSEVIKYVAQHPDAMGIIGVNWISNPNDSNKLSFDHSIRVMSVSLSENPTEDNSYKPFPAYLATHDYPLTRDVYAIISDVRDGLPAGFVSFIAGDAGQRIILKAGLVPATRPTRLINMKSNFDND